MGLAIEVGILADLKKADEEGYGMYREDFDNLNRFLRSKGMASHVEPEEVDGIFSSGMWGYSGLHALRRIALHLAFGHPVPGPAEKDRHPEDELNTAYLERSSAGEKLKFQHLIVHSDAEGFYIPIDFETVLETPHDFEIPGCWVGSTQRLHAECTELANMLQMPIERRFDCDDLLPGAKTESSWRLWRRKTTVSEPMWKPYSIETYVCLRLIAACDVSLRNKAAIVFC